MSGCFCVGPQNGEPWCPCAMGRKYKGPQAQQCVTALDLGSSLIGDVEVVPGSIVPASIPAYAKHEDERVRKLTEERDALRDELLEVERTIRQLCDGVDRYKAMFSCANDEVQTLQRLLSQLRELTGAEDYSELFLLVADKFPPQPEPHVPDLGFERPMAGQTRVRVGR